ncbi:MAG: cupin domain-containing protein [Alphaproteobacteria bacterium]|nr:cupin domain-containing protein [Alphaproteobacteria bacterium]
MLLPHIRTDDHGHSVVDEIELKLMAPGGGAVQEGTYYRRIQALPQEVSHWQIGHALPGHFVDFTRPETSTFIAVFSGKMHLTVSNGEEVQLTRGDMMLAQDLSGQGHMTRFLGNEPCEYLLIGMPGGFK